MTDPNLQLELLDEDQPDALFSFDQPSRAPYESYMSLNCRTGLVHCFSRPPGISWTSQVEQRIVLVWRIPVLTASKANSLMQANVEWFGQILGGFTEIPGHGRAYFNEEAAAAVAAVEEVCAPSNWQEWDLVGWRRAADLVNFEGREVFIRRVGLTLFSTSRDLAAIAAAEEQDVRASRPGSVTVLIGMYSLLEQLRDEMAQELIQQLVETDRRRQELTEVRDGLMRQLAATGMTFRDLAGPEGLLKSMSHMTARARVAPRSVISAARELLSSDAGWRAEGSLLYYRSVDADGLQLVIVSSAIAEVHYLAPTDEEPLRTLPTGIIHRNPRIVEGDGSADS